MNILPTINTPSAVKLVPSALPILVCPLVGLAMLLSSCGVPEAEYKTLQHENQELQRTIDRGNAQHLQLQQQLQTVRQEASTVPALRNEVQSLQNQLLEKDAEIRALQQRFDSFKAERRSAMSGMHFPTLQLDDGRLLKDVRVASVVNGEVSLRHQDGSLKIALASSSDELRWQACYEAHEERDDARKRMLAAAARTSTLTDRTQSALTTAAEMSKQNNQAAQEVRTAIMNQRSALNRAYSNLLARNPVALRGAHWDGSYPENSGLINVFSQRRAVLGISELDSLAAAIKANLTKLRDLETGGGAP